MGVNNTDLIWLNNSSWRVCQLVLGSPVQYLMADMIIIANNVGRGSLNGVVKLPHWLSCFWPVGDVSHWLGVVRAGTLPCSKKEQG